MMDVTAVNLLPPSSSTFLGLQNASSTAGLLPSELLSSVSANGVTVSGTTTTATTSALQQHLGGSTAKATGTTVTSGDDAAARSDGVVAHSGGTQVAVAPTTRLTFTGEQHETAVGGGDGNMVAATLPDRLGTTPGGTSNNGFVVKNEVVADHDRLMTTSQSQASMQGLTSTAPRAPPMPSSSESAVAAVALMQQMGQQQSAPPPPQQQPSSLHTSHNVISSHLHHSHLLSHLQLQQQQGTHLFTTAEQLAAAAAAAAASRGDPRQHLYGTAGLPSSVDCMSTQKAVAFLAGPRERIHVLGNPVEHCPRCQQEGLGTTGWRPHRHIGELKIRYICERHFDDLESNHHFDIPLCPICNQVLYLYDFNNMLGVSNARRLHKYVLKCANRHVLPLLDLFCQTKKGGERCNANFKLQWCYGTMVKRCEAQKNRDHDLWWVRYKNEWKQRRTIIRYKKDFLSHLTDAQRSLLLGLGLEGEPPPDPKSALGPTFDALVSSVGGNPSGPKIKKRTLEQRGGSLGQSDSRLNGLDGYEMNPAKQRFRASGEYGSVSFSDYSTAAVVAAAANRNHQSSSGGDGTGDSAGPRVLDEPTADPLRYVMGAVVLPSRSSSEDPNSPLMMYVGRQQAASQHPYNSTSQGLLDQLGPHSIVTGTPTPPLPTNGASPVAISVVGEPLPAPVVA